MILIFDCFETLVHNLAMDFIGHWKAYGKSIIQTAIEEAVGIE